MAAAEATPTPIYAQPLPRQATAPQAAEEQFTSERAADVITQREYREYMEAMSALAAKVNENPG